MKFKNLKKVFAEEQKKMKIGFDYRNSRSFTSNMANRIGRIADIKAGYSFEKLYLLYEIDEMKKYVEHNL